MTELQRLKGEKAIRSEILVTVLVPTYNRAKLLPRAITSLLNQTHNNIEVIVCDDGSTDDTFKVYHGIAQTYKNVRYLSIDHSSSPSAPLNAGVAKANGKYIGWLSDDCEWSSDRIEQHLKHIEISPDHQATYCAQWSIPVGSNIHEMNWDKMKNEGMEGNLYPLLKESNFISTLIAPAWLWQLLPLSEDSRMRGVEDWHLWIRMSQHILIGYAGGYQLNHDQKDSISKSMTLEETIQATACMYEDLGIQDKVRKLKSPLRKLWRRIYSYV